MASNSLDLLLSQTFSTGKVVTAMLQGAEVDAIAHASDAVRTVNRYIAEHGLSAALGAPRNRRPDGSYLELYKHCRNMTLLCAAAGGVQPIDTVFVDLKDEAGLVADCQEAAWMGYTGKITIHPSQIDIVNEHFSPSDAEIDEARRLVEAFEEAQREGLMAISFEGKMVDVPHLNRARKLLERAQQIAAFTQ